MCSSDLKPSIKGGNEDKPLSAESVQVCLVTPDWTTPYIEFLINKKLPKDDEVLSHQIERRAKAYMIIDGQLYKRSTSGIFQRCISPEEGRQILEEIHSGECGHHVAAKALVAKAFRHGFFWLTAKEDAINIVKTCEGCQRYAKQAHLPAQELRTIPITWLFAVWGLDMVGPFKTARGGLTHLLVAVDKFTKWVEAKLMTGLMGVFFSFNYANKYS